MEKKEQPVQEKWWESIESDSRFEDNKYYAIVNNVRTHEQEIYGPFSSWDELSEWFERIGFRYETEVGWRWKPITMFEGIKLGKEATILDENTPLLNGWDTMGKFIQHALKNHYDPGVPPPSEPVRSPDSVNESKFAEFFHIPKSQ